MMHRFGASADSMDDHIEFRAVSAEFVKATGLMSDLRQDSTVSTEVGDDSIAGNDDRDYDSDVFELSALTIRQHEDGVDSATFNFALNTKARASQEIIFKPGKVGLEFDRETGRVNVVSKGSQADMLGVRRGLKIVKVEGEAFDSDVLVQYAMGDSEFTVTFKDCRRSVHFSDELDVIEIEVEECIDDEDAYDEDGIVEVTSEIFQEVSAIIGGTFTRLFSAA